MSGKPEPFVQNLDMPRLNPVNMSNRKKKWTAGMLRIENPQKKIHEYMNRQDIRIAKEIEPPSCKQPQKECQLSLLSEIEGYNP